MTAAVDIIKPALYYLGAHSEIMPAAPGIITAGVDELADLLAELAQDSVDLGESITSPTTTATDLQEPAAATSALKFLLAEKMASLVQLPIKPDLRVSISKARHRINRLRDVTIPRIVPSRLSPLGSGNHGPRGHTFFSGQALDDDSSTTA